MRVEADTTFWNTGFRAALSHLAPLRLTCACSWLRVTDPRYDRMVLIEDLLGVAESERTAALGGLDARTRSELGSSPLYPGYPRPAFCVSSTRALVQVC